jgi:hypothetical protein
LTNRRGGGVNGDGWAARDLQIARGESFSVSVVRGRGRRIWSSAGSVWRSAFDGAVAQSGHR